MRNLIFEHHEKWPNCGNISKVPVGIGISSMNQSKDRQKLGALPLVEGGGAKHSPPGHGKTSLGTLGVMILRTSGSGSEDSGLQM